MVKVDTIKAHPRYKKSSAAPPSSTRTTSRTAQRSATSCASSRHDEGIQPAIDDARALFDNATVLYVSGAEPCRSSPTKKAQPRELPAWANENGIAPHTWHEFCADVGGHHLRIHSLPGIFGYDKLDEGTLLLLDNITMMARGAHVLDIGCGYDRTGGGTFRRGQRRYGRCEPARSRRSA